MSQHDQTPGISPNDAPQDFGTGEDHANTGYQPHEGQHANPNYQPDEQGDAPQYQPHAEQDRGAAPTPSHGHGHDHVEGGDPEERA